MSFDRFLSNPEIVSAVAGTTEHLLAVLRAHGAKQGESVIVLTKLAGLNLAEAKLAIDSSEVWRDRRAANESARRAAIESLGRFEFSVLEQAIESRDAAAVWHLLDEGADPNETIPDLGLTLMAVAIAAQDEDVIGVMAEFGGDIEQLDETGRSALSRAASSGDGSGMLKVLVALGAEVNSSDDRGWTALHNASVYGYHENVSVLLLAGAGPRSMTDAGQAAVDLARQNDHELDGLALPRNEA